VSFRKKAKRKKEMRFLCRWKQRKKRGSYSRNNTSIFKCFYG